MADETSDCGHHKQMSVIVRYFDDLINSSVEYFVCIKRLTAVDAQSIFDSLSFVVETIGPQLVGCNCRVL